MSVLARKCLLGKTFVDEFYIGPGLPHCTDLRQPVCPQAFTVRGALPRDNKVVPPVRVARCLRELPRMPFAIRTETGCRLGQRGRDADARRLDGVDGVEADAGTNMVGHRGRLP